MKHNHGNPRVTKEALRTWLESKGRVFLELKDGIHQLHEIFPAHNAFLDLKNADYYHDRCLAASRAFQYVMNVSYCSMRLNHATSEEEKNQWAQELSNELLKFDASVLKSGAPM